MIKAALFDFGQTPVNSAGGFHMAEKEAQVRISCDLGTPLWEEFLSNYRRIRKEFHASSNFSRKAIWQELYLHHQEPDLQLLEKWEDEYWEKVRDGTALFPETERVLETLVSEYQVALVTML